MTKTDDRHNRPNKQRFITAKLLVIIAILFFILYSYKEDIIKIFYNPSLAPSLTILDHAIKKYGDNALPTSSDINSNHDTKIPTSLNETSSQIPINHKEHKPSVQYNRELANYRSYLLNVNLLLIHFLEDKDFSKQINQLEAIQLPEEIKNILINLRDYNNTYLIQQEASKVKIFPKDSALIERLVKVERINNITQEQIKLKEHIMENLDTLLQFFYSEELQDKFIE